MAPRLDIPRLHGHGAVFGDHFAADEVAVLVDAAVDGDPELVRNKEESDRQQDGDRKTDDPAALRLGFQCVEHARNRDRR